MKPPVIPASLAAAQRAVNDAKKDLRDVDFKGNSDALKTGIAAQYALTEAKTYLRLLAKQLQHGDKP